MLRAMATKANEALHRQGFRNERTTEAYAIGSTLSAGQLVQYNIDVANGAVEGEETWAAAEPKGEQVWEIAFNQSNRVVAPKYRTTWDQVVAANEVGWAAALGL
jgi:hypothetical protein